jgi:folate-binding protein YgfZ
MPSKTPSKIQPTTPAESLKTYPLTHLAALKFKVLKQVSSPQTELSFIKDFLQGQLTCDLNEISPTQSRLFAHCNLQGRMISLGRIIEYQDSYLMILPKDIAPGAIQHLQKYAQFSKIQIEEEKNLSFTGLIFSHPNPSNNHSRELNQVFTPKELSGESIEICVQEHPLRLLKIEKAPLEPQQEKSKSNEWLCQEIENHTPFLTSKTVGKFLPHDINLPQQMGVSFKKGCFLGQEIIARMEHLGKLKKKMVLEVSNLSEKNNATAETENIENIICESECSGKRYCLRLIFRKAP